MPPSPDTLDRLHRRLHLLWQVSSLLGLLWSSLLPVVGISGWGLVLVALAGICVGFAGACLVLDDWLDAIETSI